MSTVSITSKGQITIPVEVQRKLRVRPGDKLVASFDVESQELTLRKPLTVNEVAQKLHALPRRRDVKPIVDTRAFYEAGRAAELMRQAEDNR